MRHYQIHAGLYLAAKEFRYIIILRNKTAVYPMLKKLRKQPIVRLWALGTGRTIYVFEEN